jgi:hypothetical protein
MTEKQVVVWIPVAGDARDCIDGETAKDRDREIYSSAVSQKRW